MTQLFELPKLADLKINNPQVPLYVIFWEHLNRLGFSIRQEIAKPIKDGGVNRDTFQNEICRRGILSIKLIIPYNGKNQFSGAGALIKQVMNIVNLKLYKSSYPLNTLRLCRTNRDFLCYYGTCYNDNIELVIYIGSWEDADESTHIPRALRPRSVFVHHKSYIL